MIIEDKLILGTVQFGLNYGINNFRGKPKDNEITKILDYAFSKGVNFLDTADAYGNASRLIGFYHNQQNNIFKINTKFILNNFSIQEQIESSINQLSVNSIETYFFHNYNDFINQPNSLNDLLKLKENGKIKKIGISIYENSELLTSINTQEIDVIQIPFNLLDNKSKRGDLINLAKEKGKIIQVRSVFLQGLFFLEKEQVPPKLKQLIPYLIQLKQIAIEYNISIEHLALNYVLYQDFIDYILIGVDTKEQLIKNLSFIKMKIPECAYEKIDKINVIIDHILYPKNFDLGRSHLRSL